VASGSHDQPARSWDTGLPAGATALQVSAPRHSRCAFLRAPMGRSRVRVVSAAGSCPQQHSLSGGALNAGAQTGTQRPTSEDRGAGDRNDMHALDTAHADQRAPFVKGVRPICTASLGPRSRSHYQVDRSDLERIIAEGRNACRRAPFAKGMRPIWAESPGPRSRGESAVRRPNISRPSALHGVLSL